MLSWDIFPSDPANPFDENGFKFSKGSLSSHLFNDCKFILSKYHKYKKRIFNKRRRISRQHPRIILARIAETWGRNSGLLGANSFGPSGMLVWRLVGARSILRVRLLFLRPHDGPVFPGDRVPVRNVLDALLIVEAQLRAQRADLRHTQRSRIYEEQIFTRF